MIILTLAVSVFVQPGNKAPAKLPTGTCTIVRAQGDLDNDQFLRVIVSELDRAKDASLIILEVDGNRARYDLVARLGERIASNSPPVALLLKDTADKRVGIGQAFLGGFVTHCFIDPGTRIVSAAADDVAYLAPPETNWEFVNQSVTGPLWRKLTDLKGDQTLPQGLFSPTKDLWAIPMTPGAPWKLSVAPPAGGQPGPEPRQISWSSDSRVEIDPEAAVGLGLCAGEATSHGTIISASGFSPRSTASRRAAKSGFPEAASTISRIMDDVKLAVRRIAGALKLTPSQTVVSTEEYRRAGRAALTQVDRATQELDRADALLAEYPELNRRREASRTDKGAWRPAIDALRKDLDKHRTTARDFASR